MAKKRKKPKLSTAERARRGRVAKEKLLPAGIKAAGKRGFAETAIKLAGKKGIRSPKKLSGWLKKEAAEAGLLASEHRYRGRKKTLSSKKRVKLKRIR